MEIMFFALVKNIYRWLTSPEQLVAIRCVRVWWLILE